MWLASSHAPTFCFCSEHSQLSLQVTLTAAMLHVTSLSCSHLMHFVLPKESAFHKPECCLCCRRLLYYVTFVLLEPNQRFALQMHCVHRQPVSCCACPQCSVTTTACILLCLPTVFCVHRQPVSCAARIDSPRNCCVHWADDYFDLIRDVWISGA